jgi:hypothetical protein
MSRDFGNYDAFITVNGTDYGLIYYRDGQTKPSTQSRQLSPVRQDVGNNPFETRPDAGDVFSQGDFSHGEGQRYFHRPGRDEKMYLASEGFDISKAGELRHLHVATLDSTITASGDIIQFYNDLYAADGVRVQIASGSVWPLVWESEYPHLAEGDQPVLSLASSGEYLYAALNANGIHRRDISGTWTHYSDVQGTLVAWIKDRLMAVDDNAIYEVTAAGAAPAPIETLPVGWAFESIFEIGAYIYAVATNFDDTQSAVYHYGLNSAGTAIEKKGTTLWPRGEVLHVGAGYLGLGFVGGGVPNKAGGYDPVLYQVAPDAAGFLTFARVAQEDPSTSAVDGSVRAIFATGSSVYVGWRTNPRIMASRTGLAVYDISTGAFARHLQTENGGTGFPIVSIVKFKGRLLFSEDTIGLHWEDLTKYVSDATLVASMADWNNAGQKVWDLFELTLLEDMPADSAIELDYDVGPPELATWTQAVSVAAGERGNSEHIASLKSRQLSILISSTATNDQTDAPAVSSFSVRSNPAPTTPEYVLTRFVRILPRDRKDEQGEVVYPAGGSAAAFRQTIQGLIYSWVTFYEPSDTWTARIVEISDVEPDNPRFKSSQGDEEKRGFVMRIVMEASR